MIAASGPRTPTADRQPPREDPAPPPPPSRGRGRLAAGAAGGAASAVLMTAALFGFGVLDSEAAPSASQPRAVAPTVGGARPNGDVQRIYESASEGVVSVRAGSGTGTGFVVDRDGTLVTNAHVVGSSDTVQVQFADDETAQARVAGVDRSSDLAVLKVDTSSTGPLHELELADSDGVRTGQLAVAIGSPFGLPQTATSGIVSGTGRHIQAPDGFQIDRVIQTDAPINPGNSGGPLLDARGRVIGVNSQIATGGASGGGSVGIGFAVPSNTVSDVVPRLERGEAIQRPFLGVSTAQGTGGAVVREVTSGGPAQDAGVRTGDVIVGVGGDRVSEPDDVAAAIQDMRPGQSVEVEVRRDGGVADARRRARQPRGADAMSFQQPLLLLALLAVPVAVAAVPAGRAPAAAPRARVRRARARRLGRAAPARLAPPRPARARPARARRACWPRSRARRSASRCPPSRRASCSRWTTPARCGDRRRAVAAEGDRRRRRALPRAGPRPGARRRRRVRPPRRGRADADPRPRGAAPRAAREDAPVGRHRHRRRARDLAGDAAGAQGAGRRRPPAAVVLLSDGTATHGRDPLPVADRAREMGMPVYTVALGTAAGTLPNGERVPPDTEALRQIAERSGGRAFTAEEAGALREVYERLGSQVATEREDREVTAMFAGGALVLLVGGSGLSLLWFRRLV